MFRCVFTIKQFPGDDEQSDWFGEAVGSKGWWADSDRDEDMEPTFQAILTGNLEQMSDRAKQTYRMLADRMVIYHHYQLVSSTFVVWTIRGQCYHHLRWKLLFINNVLVKCISVVYLQFVGKRKEQSEEKSKLSVLFDYITHVKLVMLGYTPNYQ